MALVCDIEPHPLQDKCFFVHLREIIDSLETTGLDPDSKKGNALFRCSDQAEHKRLMEIREKNRSCLGAMKVKVK